MRLLSAALAVVLAAGCTRSVDDEGPARAPLFPGGYQTALDRDNADPGHFSISDTTGVIRFTTGPAGVAWRPQDVVGPRDVRVQATLRLYRAPVAYREAYGVFVGGTDLESPDRSYAYLLIRASGDFTIRTRKGEDVNTVVGWTPHVAVHSVTVDGQEPVNTLVIQVRGSDADFFINGTRVFSMDVGDFDPRGIAGVRINHRLDVGLTAWSVGSPPPLAQDSTSGL